MRYLVNALHRQNAPELRAKFCQTNVTHLEAARASGPERPKARGFFTRQTQHWEVQRLYALCWSNLNISVSTACCTSSSLLLCSCQSMVLLVACTQTCTNLFKLIKCLANHEHLRVVSTQKNGHVYRKYIQLSR